MRNCHKTQHDLGLKVMQDSTKSSKTEYLVNYCHKALYVSGLPGSSIESSCDEAFVV